MRETVSSNKVVSTSDSDGFMERGEALKRSQRWARQEKEGDVILCAVQLVTRNRTCMELYETTRTRRTITE